MQIPGAEKSSTLAPVGLLRRLGAIVYDSLLLFGVLFVATALILPLAGGKAVAPGNPFFSTYVLFICFFFYGWFWTHGGQTLGMRAWKIRVQGLDGRGISWRQALLRFFAAMVSWLALGLGFLWIWVDRDRMSWHDRYSNSVLVLVKPEC